MLYFLLGVSITFNFIFVILGYKIYKKIIPTFKSTGIDISNIDTSFWGVD